MFKGFLTQLALYLGALLLGCSAARATAYTIDLTNSTASDSINGALFNFDNISSGSGSYTSMFRIQNTGTQSGYNYDGSGALPFDQKGGVSNTHVELSELPIVTINGTQYVRFNFDANDSAPLTFTDLRLYLSPDPNNTNTPVLVTSEANLSNLGKLIYDFNGGAGGPNTLQITAFTSGSGTDDMSINIPVSLIYGHEGISATDNVYLWAKTGTDSDSGFEEFAIDKSVAFTYGSLLPEAQTIWGGAVMVALLAGTALRRHWSRAAVATA